MHRFSFAYPSSAAFPAPVGTPRAFAAAALLLVVSACSSECLPEPEQDDSPPEVEIVVEYTSRIDGTSGRLEVTNADSSITVNGDSRSSVRITYLARDSTGIQRLVPGMTIQQTVGVGVERQHVALGPREASCPVPALEREHEVHGTGEKRTLVLTLGAENWVGLRSSIEPVTIRLE